MQMTRQVVRKTAITENDVAIIIAVPANIADLR